MISHLYNTEIKSPLSTLVNVGLTALQITKNKIARYNYSVYQNFQPSQVKLSKLQKTKVNNESLQFVSQIYFII
jgi:hypothetical protein